MSFNPVSNFFIVIIVCFVWGVCWAAISSLINVILRMFMLQGTYEGQNIHVYKEALATKIKIVSCLLGGMFTVILISVWIIITYHPLFVNK